MCLNRHITSNRKLVNRPGKCTCQVPTSPYVILVIACLHLTLNLLQQLLQLPLIRLLRRPLNAQPLLLIRLGNQVEVHMIHLLVCNAPVVLQNIVVFDALCDGDLLRHGEHLGQLIVGDVVQFRTVVFGDDELGAIVSASVTAAREETGKYGVGRRTEWPLLRGPMSRKASVFSDSKIFIDGISPVACQSVASSDDWLTVPLMILQNMQAAIVVLTVVLNAVVDVT